MTADFLERTPVILLDHSGYAFYRDQNGRCLIPSDCYAIRLVTDIARLDEAHGPELESVVGVPRQDERAFADAVRFQHSFGGRAAARLVAVSERLLLPAARLREELGITGPAASEALMFRDKLRMKQHLRERGITVPGFAPFSAESARDLFRTYPVLVAKPRLGAGAEDIFVLRDTRDVERFVDAHSARLTDFEVEEHVSGPLFHVDSVVQEGKVVAAVAGRYLDDTTAYRQLSPCRDVAVGGGPLLDELLAFNQRVISCYPGFTGVTHHEMFVTENGVCFCEVAARAGGGGIAAGFRSRTGTNLHEVVVQAQLGGSVPTALEIAGHLTGWVAIYAGPGVLREPIDVPGQPWVIEARVLAQPGAGLSAPASCGDAVAIISVRGESENEVIRRLATVVETAAPRVSPDR